MYVNVDSRALRKGHGRRRWNNDEEGERERGGSEKDGTGTRGRGEYSEEREAHLIRVQGTNYFPILWPAKI